MTTEPIPADARRAAPAPLPPQGPAPGLQQGGRKDGLAALTHSFVVKDLGEASIRVLAPELPHVKERLPVDVVHQPLQVVVLEDPCPQERGLHCREKRRCGHGGGPAGRPFPRLRPTRCPLLSPEASHKEGNRKLSRRRHSAARLQLNYSACSRLTARLTARPRQLRPGPSARPAQDKGQARASLHVRKRATLG